jgi:hypothetical protein
VKPVVVDTNVVLVANRAHADVSPDCVIECIDRLQAPMRTGKVVIDDAYRVLKEYQHRTSPMKNSANTRHVGQVALTGQSPDVFAEFPDAALQASVDPSDRKFLATAVAHPARPTARQAADSKWLDWWQPLKAAGVTVEFLCPDDVCRYYAGKFPDRDMPPLP